MTLTLRGNKRRTEPHAPRFVRPYDMKSTVDKVAAAVAGWLRFRRPPACPADPVNLPDLLAVAVAAGIQPNLARMVIDRAEELGLVCRCDGEDGRPGGGGYF